MALYSAKTVVIATSTKLSYQWLMPRINVVCRILMNQQSRPLGIRDLKIILNKSILNVLNISKTISFWTNKQFKKLK